MSTPPTKLLPKKPRTKPTTSQHKVGVGEENQRRGPGGRRKKRGEVRCLPKAARVSRGGERRGGGWGRGVWGEGEEKARRGGETGLDAPYRTVASSTAVAAHANAAATALPQK
uniref:Uncharacterized protein n=1 Tax=Oryza punctata TaxID=4537 RepID=A0A0E0L529_ORYPU